MIDSIRIRLMATTAVALAVLGGGATRAAANGDFQPFVTDFPKGAASTTFTPFVTDFGLAPRTGDTVVIRSTRPTHSVRAISPIRASGRDWADLGVGVGLGAGFATLAAAAGLGVRRRRSSTDSIAALGTGTAE